MGFFTSVFDLVPKADPFRTAGKVAQPMPNAANKIAAHIKAKWPELVSIPGLWFSGSQVWSFLYDREPPPGSDWDIFTCKGAKPVVSFPNGFLSDLRTERTPLGEVVDRLKPTSVVPRQAPSHKYEANGCDVKTDRGDLDLWTANADSPQAALRLYPGASHAHCRAAFSFTEGLVVLPNEAAQ